MQKKLNLYKFLEYYKKNQFLEQLYGSAPVAIRTKDRQGWGCISGEYTFAQGYRMLSAFPKFAKQSADLEKSVECKKSTKNRHV